MVFACSLNTFQDSCEIINEFLSGILIVGAVLLTFDLFPLPEPPNTHFVLKIIQ